MNIKIGKGGSGSVNSSKGGSGKTNQRKYIDLLPPNFISKVTLFSNGTDPDTDGIYTRNSGGNTVFNGPNGRTISFDLDGGRPTLMYDGDALYDSANFIDWVTINGNGEITGTTENSLSFLFDPIFYKSEIQNERHQILVQGCALPYVNGIYSQTVSPSLVNNKTFYVKDDDSDMNIIWEDNMWYLRDNAERDYYNIFTKIDSNVKSLVRPNAYNWQEPDGGDALGNETPPTITEYLNLTEYGADLDPVYLEELRNYKIDNIIPSFPFLEVRQHIPGTSFNTRKAEFKNRVYRYIKYNNNDDVEHLKDHGHVIYKSVSGGVAQDKGKNLQDLIDPLLKLKKNDTSIIFNGQLDFTLNMFIKLQRPVAHTAPGGYLVREKRGIFFNSSYFALSYRSPYYNIN